MAYAILRVAKLKTTGAIGALGQHNERTRETRNADPERQWQNIRLAGSGDWLADAQARLADVEGRIRSNAVLGIEHVLAASPEWFARASEAQVEAWALRSLDWLQQTYGERNVVAAVLHGDERTPHIQALVVPLDERDHLNARHFIGGDRGRLAALQDSYAAAVREFGLERGVRGSVAEHQQVRDWYAKLEAPVRAAQEVARTVTVEAPARVMLNPEAWAERQEERIAAVVVPAVDQAVTQAHHHAYRADRAEASVGVLSARVAQLEQTTVRLLQQKDHLEQERRELRTVVARYEQADVARARQADLPTVLERLGAERDPADPQQWRLEGERINITGEKFFNHDRGSGGGGAIDLVRHATGYTFREAMAWLGAEVGRELAEKAGLEALRPQVRAAVMEPRPAFQPPAPAEERWGQVRDYLVQERGLPAALVDRVHAAGDVYASERGGHTNAVFLSRSPDGTPTGALVRGVEEGSDYRGLVAGSQRAAGVFRVDDPGAGERAPWPARLIITEAPIDALSAYAIRSEREDRTPARIISTDGAGPVPHALIRQTLEAGGARPGGHRQRPRWRAALRADQRGTPRAGGGAAPAGAQRPQRRPAVSGAGTRGARRAGAGRGRGAGQGGAGGGRAGRPG